MLEMWTRTHLWNLQFTYKMCLTTFSPIGTFLREYEAETKTKEQWMASFQDVKDDNVKWKVPWLIQGDYLYRCEEYLWVPLPGIWGGTGYCPLLVVRQYGSMQFVPATDYEHHEGGYKAKLKKMRRS
ncbi:hypothetical protein GQ457_09G013970 [Hibiscus cannabinus]